MKIILCEDIIKVGLAGEVKDVAEGYARNYLIPRSLAMAATHANLRKWDAEKKVREIKINQNRENARNQAAQLEKVSIELTAKAGREGHLFGSITSQMIAEALLAKGFSIDRKHIILEAPIKALGEHPVSIRLHAQVTAALKVRVNAAAGAEGQEAAPSWETPEAPAAPETPAEPAPAQ